MTARLVVCFRYAAIECAAEHYVAVAQRIDHAAVMAGGDLISWGSDRYAYDFDPDDFPLVLARVLDLLLEQPEHGVGMGIGELLTIGHGQAWGRALVVACALAGAAKPGEILLDPALPEVRADRLATLGRIPVRVGERHLGAALLLPGACPHSGYRDDADRMPDSDQVTSYRTRSSIPSRTPSVFDALRSGDARTMLELSRELKRSQPGGLVGPRLEAMALLTQGQTKEGLSRLRAELARAPADVPLQRASACLALAVGLARVGEIHESALLSLEALGLSRKCRDKRAEQASAQLLAQLAATAGANDVARAWQVVSTQASAPLGA